MLAWNADYWSIAFYASGEALEITFYPVYINTHLRVSPAQMMNSLDLLIWSATVRQSWRIIYEWVQHRWWTAGPSVLANNNEDRAGGSRTSADQSSGSQVKTRQGVKRKREHGRSESRRRKKRRLDHNPNSLPMLIDNSPETRWETHE